MPLVYAPFENIITYRISILSYQQPKKYLRVLMFAIFRKTSHAQFIGLAAFKVDGGHIIKNNTYITVQKLTRIGKTYILNLVLVF